MIRAAQPSLGSPVGRLRQVIERRLRSITRQFRLPRTLSIPLGATSVGLDGTRPLDRGDRPRCPPTPGHTPSAPYRVSRDVIVDVLVGNRPASFAGEPTAVFQLALNTQALACLIARNSRVIRWAKQPRPAGCRDPDRSCTPYGPACPRRSGPRPVPSRGPIASGASEVSSRLRRALQPRADVRPSSPRNRSSSV